MNGTEHHVPPAIIAALMVILILSLLNFFGMWAILGLVRRILSLPKSRGVGKEQKKE